MLQQELNKLDSYGNEYEVALLRIRSLEKQLLEAQQYINNLEAVSQSVKDTHTNILYNTLIHDSGSTPTHNVKSLGKNKIRKYIKINKYIKKTQKLVKQYRNVNSVDLKVQNTQLQNELDLHLIETENAKLKYESDTLDLKIEILKLKELTNSLTSKFEESQCMVEKYSSAMEDLLQISNYTAECYEQLQNKTYGCNYKSQPSLQLPQTSQHTHSLTYTTTNTQLKEKIKAKERNLMYSDEMGKDMGTIVQLNDGQTFINSCYPNATFINIVKNHIIKNNDMYCIYIPTLLAPSCAKSIHCGIHIYLCENYMQDLNEENSVRN
ncbi:uncharacterized protein LOC125058597 [Pieris napi]|uniref:uncharacterized protein LOC125058597 n=1 Tax=Pieris napi TaxID=78633 RepID=UPI001FBBA6AB|nr:uncharacterized protein LOC125058597 [Pieris napi]